MRMLVAIMALVLASCTGVEAQVQDQVRRALKDPESARFEYVTVTEVEGVRVACGLVNAKNSMGGYVGNRPFMVKGDQVWLASTEAESTAVSVTCSMDNNQEPVSERHAAIRDSLASDLPVPITTY